VAARPELNEGDISPLLFYLTDAYLQLGDGVRAEESARRALEIVEGYAYQGPILLDGLLRGAKVDAYLGRWQQAEGLFREIVERSQAMDYRAGEAEALYAWGCSCAARGVTAASREKLEAALALAESMNAAELADRVRSALARLDRHLTSRGVPPSPANVSS
jgi:tetratricopeptide (TPR) repeat protein